MVRRPVALALALVALPALLGAADRVLLEGIMVRVNERIVTVSDFSDRVRSEISQISPPPSSSDEVREFVDALLQEVVNELVLMERATEKQIVIDDQMVDQALEGLRKENKLEDDAAWQQALAGADASQQVPIGQQLVRSLLRSAEFRRARDVAFQVSMLAPSNPESIALEADTLDRVSELEERQAGHNQIIHVAPFDKDGQRWLKGTWVARIDLENPRPSGGGLTSASNC